MINGINSYSNYNYTNALNNNTSNTKSSNIANDNLNLVSDKTQAVSKILGYSVDKDGFFTSDFNEAAGIPKDYKIYAKGVENLASYITNLNFKSFTSIDIAKSIGNAYKVFSQLIDEPNGNFTIEDLNKIPLGFYYDKKSFQVTNIFQTQKEFENALSANNDLQIYQNSKQLALSFPSWNEKAPSDYIKKNDDIFAPSSHIDIGQSIYKNDNGFIGKGGVLMAFFAGMSGQNPLIEGETTISGKLNGYDKNMGQSQIEDLNEFIKQNPINYGITGDIGTDFTNILKLKSNISDINEFKKRWLEMKAKSDAMGDKYKAEIAEQKLVYAENDKNPDEKPFKAIQAESKNKETYKDNDIRNEFLKKLLENSFNKAKELELLLGIKISDEDTENFNNFLLKKNLQNKSVDIRV
ncbi:Cj0814 family flagellar-dependent secreted protein [Campylobacter sp. VTCC 70190]|uniref:Cj0814 family flagellar-dependent secreted protein n=1 Tax=Campylobacter sp. VTCC 70190 TaxID=3392118 RepID=UPI00398EEA2E